ncbi:hypothetical protein ACHAXH_005829 [Discostella pseudostelligera]
MHPPNNNATFHRSTKSVILALFVFIAASSPTFNNHDGHCLLVSASAIAPPTMATARSNKKREPSTSVSSSAAVTDDREIVMTSASSTVASVTQMPADETRLALTNSGNDEADTSTSTSTSSTSSNPIVQLFTYMKDTAVNFKNGLGQMNSDHRRCNTIRAKQRDYVKTTISSSSQRPRGIKGIQTGGISYEEYDFLKKGLIDRNKLFAVVVVSLCLPNYFVYYLWSFPDMMPSPFAKRKDINEISRERCHAVITTLLDIEQGARVAPWSSKLNPFGRKATERAMKRLDSFIGMGCTHMMENGAHGPNGGKLLLEKLKPYLYTSQPLTKQQRLLLSGNILPKQFMKGLAKAISADPLNKGSSPFGIGPIKQIESVTLADEFLVDQEIDLDSINSALLEEACSARLIGGPGWTDEERKVALMSWLQETEITPREMMKGTTGRGGGVEVEGGDIGGGGGGDNNVLHYNGNLARAALMCYNAVDATRDRRADSRLLRSMYQGQQNGN